MDVKDLNLDKGKMKFFYAVALIVAIYVFITGLAEAEPFLAPFLTAVILSLVTLPLAQKMEKGPFNRMTASLVNTIILFLISIGLLTLISMEIKNFLSDWNKIQQTMEPKIEQVKEYLFENTPLQRGDFQDTVAGKEDGKTVPVKSKKALNFVAYVAGLLGNYLLVFIYVFFLLNYRRRFKEFLLKIFPDEKRDAVKKTITDSARVAPQYLAGKLTLMGILAVLYSIGLGLSGVNNFILVSIIAALLTIIPYIGNMIGVFLALAFGYLGTGNTMTLIGILATFSVSQFVESYILLPYVVGDRVDVHPFFVILMVVIGNMVWGMMGMILAVPVTAILTVLLLHIKPLKVYGELLSKKSIPN